MIIDLVLVETSQQRYIVKEIIEGHHSYVASNDSVGRRVDWLIRVDKRIVGMIGLGSSVYPPPKDLLRAVRMSKNEYKDAFNQFANNWRFCLTESIPNLGTRVLKLMRKQGPYEWARQYGDDLHWILTFVGDGKPGTVYKADNWQYVGQTAGLPPHASCSMKWDTNEALKQKFVKPTGENRKDIYLKQVEPSDYKPDCKTVSFDKWFSQTSLSTVGRSGES